MSKAAAFVNTERYSRALALLADGKLFPGLGPVIWREDPQIQDAHCPNNFGFRDLANTSPVRCTLTRVP
jgi:hypothetical protein